MPWLKRSGLLASVALVAACGSDGDSDARSQSTGNPADDGGSGGALDAAESEAGDGGANASGGSADGGGASSSDSSAGMQAVSTAAQLYADMTAIYCEALVPCCTGTSVSLNMAQCIETFGDLLGAQIANANPDLFSFDAVQGGRCLDTVSDSLGVGCDFSPDVVPRCDAVFQGQLAPGSPCAASVECARAPGDSVSCEAGADGGTICVVDRRAGEGDPCEWTCRTERGTQICAGSPNDEPIQGRCFTADGLFCSNAGVCETRALVGGSCSSPFGCVEATWCDFVSDTCVARSPAGADCGTSQECTDGLYCDGGICVPTLAAGSPCPDLGTACQSGFCDEGQCGDVTLQVGLACQVVANELPVTP